jgi:hypothetical protein
MEYITRGKGGMEDIDYLTTRLSYMIPGSMTDGEVDLTSMWPNREMPVDAQTDHWGMGKTTFLCREWTSCLAHSVDRILQCCS